MMTEGMGVSLDPHFSLGATLGPYAQRLLANRYSPATIAQQLAGAGSDALEILGQLPAPAPPAAEGARRRWPGAAPADGRVGADAGPARRGEQAGRLRSPDGRPGPRCARPARGPGRSAACVRRAAARRDDRAVPLRWPRTTAGRADPDGHADRALSPCSNRGSQRRRRPAGAAPPAARRCRGRRGRPAPSRPAPGSCAPTSGPRARGSRGA